MSDREQRNRAVAAAREYDPTTAEFLEHEFETTTCCASTFPSRAPRPRAASRRAAPAAAGC
jgi:hypothetical protein